MSPNDKELELVDLDGADGVPPSDAASDDTASSRPAEPRFIEVDSPTTATSEDISNSPTEGEVVPDDEGTGRKIEIGANRRVAVRHPMISLVDVFDQKRNRNLGRVSDLSVHGFKVVTLNAIIPGTTVNLKLVPKAPISADDFVVVKGICRWCLPADGDVFRLGFEFTNLDEKKKQAVVGLIHRLPG